MVFPVVGGTQDTGYEIENSLRVNHGDSPFLSRSISSTGNERTATVSVWVKRALFGTEHVIFSNKISSAGSNCFKFVFFDDDELSIQIGTTGNSNTTLTTNRKFRDPSAWYHLMAVIDTTQGTEANRVRIYVNGQEETSFSETGYPSQNADMRISNSSFPHTIGEDPRDNTHFNGYLSEMHFVDGTALTPSSFGETNDNGVWIPKKYTGGSYGTNGFYMEFKQTGTSQNSSGIGADTSGNDNHFAVSNLVAGDVTEDTPTNNFCTWNPLVVRGGSDDLVYTEGNTGVSSNQHATNNYTFGTQGFANGKWYWEVECETVGGEMHIGIVDSGSSTTGYPSTARDYRNNGNKELDGGSATSFGNTYTDGDIIGVAVDLDNTSIYYSKNGTWQNSGDPESGSSKTGAAYTDISSTNFPNFVLPWVAGAGVNGGADMKAFANFGNAPFSISSGNSDANGYGNFEYAVPSGYYALCTKNLAEYG